ncbi:MAG: NAD-dependent DNA ligase LigA, partial [Niameybacter sp.]
MNYEEKMQRMQELVELLKKAAYAYEQEDRELMSNFEYDKLYDELIKLEEETGTVLAGSVTQKVGYEVASNLKKVTHPSRMLSLDKTKEVDRLKNFLGEQLGMLSWKLDGLTIVCTYEDGKLVQAVTRGNGEIGEDVTNNAKTFVNLPLTIAYKEPLVIRGEAVITYSDFERINERLESEEKYKNPRNLCSGSVRQLNSEITAKRNVRLYA